MMPEDWESKQLEYFKVFIEDNMSQWYMDYVIAYPKVGNMSQYDLNFLRLFHFGPQRNHSLFSIVLISAKVAHMFISNDSFQWLAWYSPWVTCTLHGNNKQIEMHQNEFVKTVSMEYVSAKQ